MVGLTLATASTFEPLSTDQVKAHLLIETDAADDYIDECIEDAREWLEEEYGVACCEQTWDQVMDCFPLGSQPITLYRKPVQSITSIVYRDGSGAEIAMDTTGYAANLAGDPPRVAPTGASSWPVADWGSLATVTIRFVAGAATAKQVPHRFRRALYLLIGEWFANREASMIGTREVSLETAHSIDRIMGPGPVAR